MLQTTLYFVELHGVRALNKPQCYRCQRTAFHDVSHLEQSSPYEDLILLRKHRTSFIQQGPVYQAVAGLNTILGRYEQYSPA